jgi:serine/threonine-protein kinase
MSREDATSRLQDAGFEVEVTEREDDSADPGTVLMQDPYNQRAPRGSTVTITVAKRPPQVQVPSVGGSSLADATATLRGAGLQVAATEQPVTDPSQDGTVIGQDPAPGTEVRRGSRVNLVVGTFQGGDDGATPDEGGGPGQGLGPEGEGPPGQEEDG